VARNVVPQMETVAQFGYLFSTTNVFGRKPSLTSQKMAIFDLNYKI
jgi:hypothetical protein